VVFDGACTKRCDETTSELHAKAVHLATAGISFGLLCLAVCGVIVRVSSWFWCAIGLMSDHDRGELSEFLERMATERSNGQRAILSGYPGSTTERAIVSGYPGSTTERAIVSGSTTERARAQQARVCSISCVQCAASSRREAWLEGETSQRAALT